MPVPKQSHLLSQELFSVGHIGLVFHPLPLDRNWENMLDMVVIKTSVFITRWLLTFWADYRFESQQKKLRFVSSNKKLIYHRLSEISLLPLLQLVLKTLITVCGCQVVLQWTGKFLTSTLWTSTVGLSGLWWLRGDAKTFSATQGVVPEMDTVWEQVLLNTRAMLTSKAIQALAWTCHW